MPSPKPKPTPKSRPPRRPAGSAKPSPKQRGRAATTPDPRRGVLHSRTPGSHSPAPNGRVAPGTAADLADPVAAAKAAGLRYSPDGRPGIRRRRAGKGWHYVGPDGETVRDEATLARIRSLVIPPGYTDVWINPDPRGHIQATGRDARGRKQYRYHPKWQATRDETKFGRMLPFAEALPAVRRRVEADLALPGMAREKVLATVVRLLETTSLRVGNEEYARANDSFGLTTLRNDHVAVEGSTVHLAFRGKHGKAHEVDVRDRRLARIVRRCQDLPGQHLFGYLDGDGTPRTVDSGDVNDYLREITGEGFSAKDFRTWNGTVLAARELARIGPAPTASAAKANLVRAVDAVAAVLGNTRAVCRRSYIHPAVLEGYLDGTLLPGLQEARRHPVDGLSAEESALLGYLRVRAEGQEMGGTQGKRAA